MNTPAMIMALIVFPTTSLVWAQDPAVPRTQAPLSGAYEHSIHTALQATWPSAHPLRQAVLSQVAASVTPRAGAGATIGRGGGAGPMTGRSHGMGPRTGRGGGMHARPHDGMKGPWKGSGNWQNHAQGGKGHSHGFQQGYSPWGYMRHNHNGGYYFNPQGYSPYGYGNHYSNPYAGGYYSPNWYAYPNHGYYYYGNPWSSYGHPWSFPNYGYYGYYGW